LLVLLVLSLAAAFLTLNWSVVMAPAHLSLFFTTLEAPIGLVMLAILAAVVFAFVSYLAIGQSTSLLASRRHAKALQAQRDLADQAEASRFTELRAVMIAELERLANRVSQEQDALRTEIRDNANAIAATIGELDQRLQSQAREIIAPSTAKAAANLDGRP
jgi:predicted membrane protein